MIFLGREEVGIKINLPYENDWSIYIVGLDQFSLEQGKRMRMLINNHDHNQQLI